MNHSASRPNSEGKTLPEIAIIIRTAAEEFLGVPTAIIAGFLLLALGTYLLDRAESTSLIRRFMQQHIFGDAQATSDLLGTIASGIITVTSITISILLLAVQQSAASLTHQVFDQFLRRRMNQVAFGFFIGLAVYTLVILATVDPPFNPVYGASVALLLTGVALYLLLLLLYGTIDQMRPSVIVEAIHDHTLRARERQLSLLRKTRRRSRYEGAVTVPVQATSHGFVVSIDVDAIGAGVEKAEAQAEIVLLVEIGSYVAFQDTIAEIKAATTELTPDLETAVREAIHLEKKRDIANDPEFGIEQLETIGWTASSGAKQTPSPGLLVIRSLRDLLARWSREGEGEAAAEPPAPVVYTDGVMAALMSAFESLAVVATESMQHQNYAEIVQTFALTFDRLSPEDQRRAEDLILRILSGLGDIVLTRQLDEALGRLVSTLRSAGRFDTAVAVETARCALAQSIGELNSRSTRVPG